VRSQRQKTQEAQQLTFGESLTRGLRKWGGDLASTVEVTINGKEEPHAAGMTIADYLASRELKDRLVVVELNGEIIKRTDFPSITIKAGDEIEIVHFVGGG
jgi:sulfur carrier protein